MQEINPPDQTLRWSIAQRLEFIEFRLVWEGRIKRSDIADRFGVTVQQATVDLGLYEQVAPGNILYDRNAKRFVPSRSFVPQFLRPSANRQLLQLAAIGRGDVAEKETWFDELPVIGVVPVPQRNVCTIAMRWILEAMRTASELSIEYQSVNRAARTRRTIAPHALGHDGTRWHVRAFCVSNREFRDFVLSRVGEPEILGPRMVDPHADREWFDEIELVLVPNPALDETARKGLVQEYQMKKGQLRVRTRVALAFYLIQHMNLDLKLPPRRQQLVLTNLDEVDAACERAKAATKQALGDA